MYRATDGIVLPTSIIGSLPRPAWYTENLGRRSFIEAMINARFREQYTDAVSCFLRDQDVAGLDIVTDGDARFDIEVNGYSWFSYPLARMGGFSLDQAFRRPQFAKGRLPYQRGHILHEGMEARLLPRITGPVTRGDLQYTPLFMAAQRLTTKPLKFGTITAELIGMAVRDEYYKDRRESIMAISNALRDELVELADAGCTCIQMEEPQVHLIGPRGGVDAVLTPEFMVEVFNNTVKGLRAKTEIWCHTCWGNPAQQRIITLAQSYKPALENLNRCDADVLTFETCTSGGADLEAIGQRITGKKIGIGVIDHHSLQVERPEEVAALIRQALKFIPAERLVISSDCGMGREGMSRRHALYKMVALVLGTNIVRKELGLPEARCLAAEPHMTLVEQI
jgi:5-methyltetrahydropteroyltriglutamate--homocysteine methyltransferase